MSNIPDKIIRISAESTPSFVRAVFDFYATGKVFAVVRPDVADDDRLRGAETFDIETSETSGWIDSTLTPNWSDDPAQVVFSSGTEGRPKAIVLSHRNLADVVDRLNTAMEVTSDIREYIGVPVTYSFGLGRARAVATAGGRAYLPERFDPAEIAHMLKAKEINAFSAVPSLCRILLKSKDIFADVAHEVRWIEIGSQFMSRDEKLAMRDLFPNARILQHYGLTEASRSTFLNISGASPDDLASVGPVDGPVEIRIDDEGAICIRGAHVALGNLLASDEMAPLTDADGWLVTRDRGEVRNGHLHFLGRLDDQINISGIKVSADQLEEQLRKHEPGLGGHFAIAAVDDPLRGQIALLVTETAIADAEPKLETALGEAMSGFGIPGGDGFQVFSVDRLPLTGTGKVQRAALKDAYLASAPATDMAGGDKGSVRGIFQAHFPRAEITPELTFERLGGDSLSYLSIALDLERVLGELPEAWEQQPIGALEKIKPNKGFLARTDVLTVMRALSICLIVVGHLGAFDYGGSGAFVLFFIAGMSFASLSLPAVLQTSSVVPVVVLMLRIAFLAWAYMTLQLVATGYGGAFSYLFISNWIDPNYPGGNWFIGVYLQIAFVMAVLLSFERVRDEVRQRPFETATGLTVAFILALILSELFIDTNSLYRRLPQILGWMFASGVALHFADTLGRKWLTLFLFVVGYVIYLEFSITNLRFVMLAVPILVFVPYVSLPRLSIPAIRLIAGASLIIYLTHFQFKKVLGAVGITDPWLASLVAIAGGVVGYMIYRPIDDRVRRGLLRLFRA